MPTELVECEFEVHPETRAEIPLSEGYTLYSSLLDRIETADAAVSDALHDEYGHLHTPGLQGEFAPADGRGRKRLTDDTYTLPVRLITDDTVDADALLDQLAFGRGDLQVGDATFNIVSATLDSCTLTELWETAATYTRPYIQMSFISPTCILAGSQGSTEMFPHRAGVFQSLQSSWNVFADASLQMEVSTAEMRDWLYEIPDHDSLHACNPVIKVVDDGSSKQLIKRHGFKGECTYHFQSDPPTDIQTSLTALALAAEYFGVGSAVSRGCGGVEVTLSE